MFLIFLALIVAALVVKAFQNEKKRKAGEYNASVQATTDDLYVDTGFQAMDVFIAGLGHHCSRSDIGMFTGVVYNEKGNPANRKAMAIWDGRTQKVIGYVPEAILDKYHDYSKGKRCPCVGYIYFDGENLRGRIRSYTSDLEKESVMKDIDDYAKQVCEHFGWTVPHFTAE